MKNAVIIILCLLLIGLGGYIVYDKFIDKDTKENDNITEKDSNNKEVVEKKDSNNQEVEEEKVVLNELTGTWYETSASLSFPNSNYLIIKSVDGNKLTFDMYFTRTAEFENASVEISGNSGEFEAISENGLNGEGNPGKAKFKMLIGEDNIKLTVLETDVRDLESGKEYNFTYIIK